MSNAFEPTNPTDNCAYCGRVRASDWHRVTSNPGTHAFVEPGPQADSAATIAHAFEPPPRGTYACGLCGRSELHSDHPAQPNPAPSGDEAKVRGDGARACECKSAHSPPCSFCAEADEEAGHNPVLNRIWAECCGSLTFHSLTRAYAAGKADGAREERAECELTVRDSCICQVAECSCSARLRDIARAIARRGSEGK